MRKILSILSFILLSQLFTSCMSEEKIIGKIILEPDKFCTHCPKSKDTVIYKEKFRVDTIKRDVIDSTYAYSIIDLVRFQAEIKCDSLNKAQMDSIKFHSKKGSGVIYVKDGELRLAYMNLNDSIVKLRQTILTIQKEKEIQKDIIKTYEKQIINIPEHKYYKCIWFYIACVFIILSFIILIKKS